MFLPGKSHGLRSLVGYSPWGSKESDTTEQLHFHLLNSFKWLYSIPSAAPQIGTLRWFSGTSLAVQLLRPPSNARGTASIPSQGTKILHIERYGQKLKINQKKCFWRLFSVWGTCKEYHSGCPCTWFFSHEHLCFCRMVLEVEWDDASIF